LDTEEFVAVTPADAIDEKDFSCFEIDGMSIVICRLNDKYFALQNECSHALEANVSFARGTAGHSIFAMARRALRRPKGPSGRFQCGSWMVWSR